MLRRSDRRVGLRSKSLFRQVLRQRRRRQLHAEALEPRSLLAVVTWDGGAGTLNFGDAANWDTNVVPGAADDAVIPDLAGAPTIVNAAARSVRSLTSAELVQHSSGTFAVSAHSSLAAGLVLSGGSLSIGAGAVVTADGTSSWTGAGAMTGTGTFRNVGTLTFAPSASRTAPSTFENSGTFRHQAAGTSVLTLPAGGLFDNQSTGLVEINNGAAAPFGGATATLRNAGTVRKINSLATTSLGVLVNSEQGTWESTIGTLQIAGGASPFHGGALVAASGATVQVLNARPWSGTVTGSGAGAVLIGGTLNVESSGVTFDFPAGLASWNGATFNGPGTVTVAAGSFVGFGSAGNSLNTQLDVSGTLTRTVTGGAVTINATGRLNVGVGGQIVDSAIGTAVGGAGNLVIAGTWHKTAGSSTTISPTTIDVSGVITVDTGILTITGTGGLFEDATFEVAAGAEVRSTGAQTWRGTISGAGPGLVSKSGTLRADAAGTTLDFAADALELGGTITGPGVVAVAAGSHATFSNSGAKFLTTELRLEGTAHYDNSTIFNVDAPGVLHVAPTGRWETSGAGGIHYQTTPGAVWNEGTMMFAPPPTALSYNLNIPLDSTGAMIVTQGTLQLTGAVAQHAGGVLTGGEWFLAGRLNLGSISNPVRVIGPAASVTLSGPSASFTWLENNRLEENQGALTVTGGKALATAVGSFVNQGVVTIDVNSSLTVPTTIGTPVSGYSQSAGRTVLRGGELSATNVTLLAGELAGTGTVSADVDNVAANVTPGASPGVLTINGQYVQEPGATLTVEVAGTNAATPEFDQLFVTGGATLHGTLDVLTLDDFLPSKGETFRFLTTGAGITGDFAQKNLAVYQEYPLFGTATGPSGAPTYYDLTSLNIIVRNAADVGAFSLRAAIEQSNAAPDPDVILMHVPGAGPHVIAPSSPLPTIIEPVKIDGYAQIGARVNALDNADDAVLKVEVNGTGAGAGAVAGFDVAASDVTLQGFAVRGFSGPQIRVSGAATSNVRIVGNFLGTDVTGTTAGGHPAVDDFSAGVLLEGGAHDVQVGTNGDGVGDLAERNVVAGNRWSGVAIRGVGTDDNVVAGNFVGLGADGVTVLANGHVGTFGGAVYVDGGARGTRIGADGSDDDFNRVERNILAGQIDGAGVVVRSPGTDGTVIAGNDVGLDASGGQAAANSAGGVLVGGVGVWAGATNTRIGSDGNGVRDDAERNVIGGNGGAGVTIIGADSTTIAGNSIGLDRALAAAFPNAGSGVELIDATNATVGGTAAALRNYVAGNSGDGVRVQGAATAGVQVVGNFVGLNGSEAAAANGGAGVRLSDVAGVQIGGVSSGAGNVIAANLHDGIVITGAASTANEVTGNFVGTQSNGLTALPNSGAGIRIEAGAHDNRIGGATTAARNVLSGNFGPGVLLTGAGVVRNQLLGNYVGLGADGATRAANVGAGIAIEGGASFNQIGGVGASNVASGNVGAGIALDGATSTGNQIVGNLVGVGTNGIVPRGNDGGGVRVTNAAGNTIGGAFAGARNVISGNAVAGVSLEGPAATANVLVGNVIGVDASGTMAVPNPVGVQVLAGAHDNQIGVDATWPNVIGGNVATGLWFDGVGTDGNVAFGNHVGVNAAGLTALPNGIGVVVSGGAVGNSIGDGSDAHRNLIGGNAGDGVQVRGAATRGQVIAGNFVGVDTFGSRDLGNAGSGIAIIAGASETTVDGNVISGNALDGILVSGPGAQGNLLVGNHVGLDVSGSLVVGNDRFGVLLEAGPSGTIVDENVISGNAAGIKNDATATVLIANRVGTNAAGLRSLGNRRGSGLTTGGHFGIQSSGPDVVLGDLGQGNVVAGHDDGVWVLGAGASGVVRDNRIGTDVSALESLSNTIGLRLSNGAAGLVIEQNVIANGLLAGLRLEDGASRDNTFSSNRYFGNLGPAIDGGDAGVTRNDADDVDGLLNYPVLDSAELVGDDLVLRGFVGAGRTVELYVSTPTVSGFGQGNVLLGVRQEGAASDDFDASSGPYGPTIRGVDVGTDVAERFEFRLPRATLPAALRYGSLVTAVALGSTSEFGNSLTVGDPASRLGPRILLPVGLSLTQGESLRLQGSFVDDDSTDFTLTVDYGDGTGPQPLAYSADRTFLLEHTYLTDSPEPFVVRVTAVDNGGAVGAAEMRVSITNEPPQPNFNSFSFEPRVVEGDLVTLHGAFSDPGASDTHVVTIQWGDATPATTIPLPPGAREFTATHVYPDDGVSYAPSETYRIVVTVADNHGGFNTTPDGLYVIEVVNAAPTTPSVTAPTVVQENQLFALVGSFADLGVEDTHRVTIDWGDGSAPEAVDVAQLLADPRERTFTALHRYPNDSTASAAGYLVTIDVADDDEPLEVRQVTHAITVLNDAPFFTSIEPSRLSLNEGETLGLTIRIDDAGPRDSHELIVDWGDGSTPRLVTLPSGVSVVSDLTHRYEDQPSVGGEFLVQVKLRDRSMPVGTYVTDARSIAVANVAPTIDDLRLYARDATGTWLERAAGYEVREGETVRVSGTYVDPGRRDAQTVRVEWAPGRFTTARVNSTTRTFAASFTYGDDFATGTSVDVETIGVTIDDGDGGVGFASTSVQVANVAPEARFVPALSVDPNLVTFNSIVADASDADAATLTFAWNATDGVTTLVGGAADFTFARSSLAAGPITVTLTVSDDDGGVATYRAGLVFGTNGPDDGVSNPVVRVDDTSFPAGIEVLVVMGLGGSDVLDATGVTAPGLRVILDGGAGQDWLFGGSNDDTYVLRAGDDFANVVPPTPAPGVPTVANRAGNDRYVLVPNSILTVFDDLGDNSLDFSLANFGVTFDLSATDGVAQDVAPLAQPDEHFVSADGSFGTLYGSRFADDLTGASGGAVYGGVGADRLFALAGATDARFYGGADADLFTTLGTSIRGINFEGDDGADVLTVSAGSGVSGLIFLGGADADLLVVASGGVATAVNFAGDDGADLFTNLGVVTGAVFSAGADADRFVNEGTVSGGLVFQGDDGADVFENTLGGVVTGILFEGDVGADEVRNYGRLEALSPTDRVAGDDGADVFLNVGTVVGLTFVGGADADLFTNSLGGVATNVLFEGDDGADVLTNVGVIAGVSGMTFTGGADADLLTNSLGGVATSINFAGDDGADVLINLGTVSTGIIFTGGADADLLTNSLGGVATSINFAGDDGADILTNLGTVSTGIIFTGGADADLLTNSLGGVATSINFAGDDGADVLTNLGTVSTGIIFTGGADADLLTNSLGGVATSINFAGDDGADVLINLGTVSTGIIFTGGADADLLTNSLGGVAASINFAGDDGADVLTNLGTVSTGIIFTGGADADLLTNSLGGVANSINFAGDDGADVLINLGTVSTGIIFTGGADADLLTNSLGGVATSINFAGDDGADVLINAGTTVSLTFVGGADADRLRNSADGVAAIVFQGGGGLNPSADGGDLLMNSGAFVGAIDFTGDLGADVLYNLGSNVGALHFTGDDGADVLVSTGHSLGSILFEGDDGADVLITSGIHVGSILFEGDEAGAVVGGKDTFVNRAEAAPGATLVFRGSLGQDSLRNDGTGWASVDFTGGGDADAFQNNAAGLTSVTFRGDDGADVFENNGLSVSNVTFIAGADRDVFANGGDGARSLAFVGQEDADLFVNVGSSVTGIVFEGDEGADLFVNLGTLVTGVLFEGDDGPDRLLNSGGEFSGVSFTGGAGGDSVVLLEAGAGVHDLNFLAGATDDGVDEFVNYAADVSRIVMEGGAEADRFQNLGIFMSAVTFVGDDGPDTFVNAGYGLSGARFVGGEGADQLEQRGDGVAILASVSPEFAVEFDGGRGADRFLQHGSHGAALVFLGGEDADVFLNDGSHLDGWTFDGGAGDDRLQNDGDDVATIVFLARTGDDALRTSGVGLGSLQFVGDSGADLLSLGGAGAANVQFLGGPDSDSLISSADSLGDVLFDAGSGDDVARLRGAGLDRLSFVGDTGIDSLLFDVDAGLGAQVDFSAGEGDDLLSFRGVVGELVFLGGAGHERSVFAGQATVAQLNGGAGNDRYEFASAPGGAIQIVEAYAGAADVSLDTLDFSAVTAVPISLDLAVTVPQPQPGGWTLAISDALGIENVLGTRGADSVYGNDRDNYLAGALFYHETLSPSVPARGTPQRVLLRFLEPGVVGEHRYSAGEISQIVARLRAAFEGPDAEHPWFEVRFTTDPDAPELAGRVEGEDFVVIEFNATPEYGRPGGESSEVDFGNVQAGGRARVQVNGLLGGVELPDATTETFVEELPEDGARNAGEDKPAATSENFVALSVKIAAHELGHLLGLRHYDAFGPIGFGVHSPPALDAFKPAFAGPSGAFETFDHLIGSPASIGSDRWNDVGPLFFGEREAAKLAFAQADQTLVRQDESSLVVDEPSGARWLPWATIAVPTTLARGVNVDKAFFVEAMSVVGAIELDEFGRSENDRYAFTGRAGDLVSVEVLSRSLRRYLDAGVADNVDSVVRLFDAEGNLVEHFAGVAMNDDEFESTDSLLIDVTLPADGTYFVEVDTFARGPRANDPTPEELATWPEESRTLLLDALHDTDVGRYELFVQRFARQNRSDLFDDLIGRGGVDVIDGGFGESFAIEVNAPESFETEENVAVNAVVSFRDRAGADWTAQVDYGDGVVQEFTEVQPDVPFGGTHVYANDGAFAITVRVVNDDGLDTVRVVPVLVHNVAPTATINAPAPIDEGDSATITLTAPFDPSPVDTAAGFRYSFALAETDLAGSYAAAGAASSGTLTFDDDGTYVVFARIFDQDDGARDYQTTVTVRNVAPTATLTNDGPTAVGGIVQVTFSSPWDPSLTDRAQGFRYSFALAEGDLADDFASARPEATANFVMAVAGTIPIYARIFDKDGGATDSVTNVEVTGGGTNSPPQVSIDGPVDGVAGVASTFTFRASDADAADAAGPFTYSIDWGDGTAPQVVAGGASLAVSHVYATVSVSGTFVVSATATDARGATGPRETAAFAALGWGVLADPLHVGHVLLVVVGTEGDDSITIKDWGKHDDYLRVKVRDREADVRYRGLVSADVDLIVVYALGGDDRVTLDDDIEISAYVRGGDGDDRLRGGEANDILLGELGDDVLYGEEGRDLLIGGAGADQIHGDQDEDILVAGYTTFDQDRAALEAIMAEWASSRTAAQRRQNLMGVDQPAFASRRNGDVFLKFDGATAAANTVLDDGARDVLWGGKGLDWFLLNRDGDGDRRTARDEQRDASSGDWLDDLDRWW